MSELIVSEVFGPTFQGEGPTAGQRCAFVRLGRCNLNCSWCDTSYTWDWRGQNGTVFDPAVELSRVELREVVDDLDQMHVNRVVITGGEPLVQRSALETLVLVLANTRDWHVEIETNGTLMPSDPLLLDVAQWNVSPKLANSGIPRERRIRPDVLMKFAECPRVAFKFVVSNAGDLDEIAELDAELHLSDYHGRGRIWIMPEGRTDAELLARAQALAPRVLSEGWNLTLRQQVLLWGDTRGT